MKKFQIIKILTHNILLATYESNEYILIGKGIGFQKKPGMLVEAQQVSNYYIIQDMKKLSVYEKMVLETPDDVLLATENAILLAENELHQKFDESIHLSLLDHIRFALYRMENNLQVGSFLTDEYYLMYPELYQISEKMAVMINQLMKVTLPTSEIGAIILHLHAALNQEKVSQTAINAQVITFALDFIQENSFLKLAENDLAKARLITHLKFALKRSADQKMHENPLVSVIEKEYPAVYQLSKTLAQEIDNRFAIRLSNSEVGYVALHLYNLQF